MIIVGEKVNGAIPSIRQAIEKRDAGLIAQRAVSQAQAGSDFLDCAPSTAPEVVYDAMVWLLDVMQGAVDVPLRIDSPNAGLLARVIEEGRVNRPGMVNSVNEEGDKCEVIFPLIANTSWHVVGLTCDKEGIPQDPAKKVDIAKRIIEKAERFGVALGQLHIDPCVMALATKPDAMQDIAYCIEHIHAFAPEVKVACAVSNVSFDMPARKYVNMGCLAYALAAGLDTAIMDPCSKDMMGMLFTCEALRQNDKSGRKYNRAYRKGIFENKA